MILSGSREDGVEMVEKELIGFLGCVVSVAGIAAIELFGSGEE